MTYRELLVATRARLAFDFDRAAAVCAALSSKSVNPRDLNPYRKKRVRETTVAEVERQHRAHVAGGRHIEQVITMDQVVQ